MESETPLDFVNLYLTDEFWNLLVTKTNRFVRQFLANDLPNTYTGLWTPVDVNDMKSFIAIIILMGLNHKPSLPMYWSVDDFLYTPIFSQIMTRNRFYLILRFLHFNDNEDPLHDINYENRDRLHKLRPLINLFQNRCRTVYNPGKHLSVDESLVLFKGRLKFRQYIKTKRARFGIKLYELCTSDGITLDLLVYCGKGMFSNDAPNSDMPTTERIPSVLMSRHLGKGRILYTDNYYTSPTLALYFLQNNTHLVGTIRSNRYNFPKDLIPIPLEKAKASFYCQEEDPQKPNEEVYPMLAIKYRANKDKAGGKQKIIFMLSTCHQPIMERAKPNSDVLKPIAIKSYNQHMGGVDRVDQQLHSLLGLRKTYKWYRKLAFRLVLQMILNAYKIYVQRNNSSISFIDYVLDVVKMLVSNTENIPDTIRRARK